MKIDDLKPWMRGPFELIRHADGHLKDKGDTDRRIALIGFDNAIEVSIDVYVRLHPKIRGGIEIPKAEVEAATRNYHTKIEFLDKHVQDRQIPLTIPVAEIVWYHQLRNELYHSGNGMVPEEHVIVSARSAALSVFQALFTVDIAGLLSDGRPAAKEKVSRSLVQTQNPEMEFLRWFIELEKEVRRFSPSGSEKSMAFFQTWQSLLKVRPNLVVLNDQMVELVRTRNALVHGHAGPDGMPEKIERGKESILEILDGLHNS